MIVIYISILTIWLSTHTSWIHKWIRENRKRKLMQIIHDLQYKSMSHNHARLRSRLHSWSHWNHNTNYNGRSCNIEKAFNQHVWHWLINRTFFWRQNTIMFLIQTAQKSPQVPQSSTAYLFSLNRSYINYIAQDS